MSSESRRIEEWNGPIHWGSREIAVEPTTNHSNHESREAGQNLEPLPVDRPACTDEIADISRTQSAIPTDPVQEVHRQSALPADQCNERR